MNLSPPIQAAHRVGLYEFVMEIMLDLFHRMLSDAPANIRCKWKEVIGMVENISRLRM